MLMKQEQPKRTERFDVRESTTRRVQDNSLCRGLGKRVYGMLFGWDELKWHRLESVRTGRKGALKPQTEVCVTCMLTSNQTKKC